MKDKIVTAFVNLIKIKSIVTLSLTAAFVIMTLRGAISEQQFIPIFTTVTAFYFGTQKVKENEKSSSSDEYVEKTPAIGFQMDTDEYHED